MTLPEERVEWVCFEGLTFRVPGNVYKPAEDTFLLAENLHVTPRETVLDMGTGCGLLAVLSAKKTERVFAIDINPHAARCASENGRLNGVHNRLNIICGDLFEPLREDIKFDVIVFNAPYLPSEGLKGRSELRDWLETAWSGGEDGREVIDRFTSEAPKRLKKGGRILLLQSTLSDEEATVRRFRDAGLKVEVIVEKPLFFEKMILLKAVRPS
ncbi:MAG: methyltransferase [Candidatus Bathyarchaeota archaeon B26-2]|nr:MAG: methyltransferase [Candidatus Bathyarchaeota archaeon B26-2]